MAQDYINSWICNDMAKIIELYTIAWKLDMKISLHYNSICLENPLSYNLSGKYINPEFL